MKVSVHYRFGIKSEEFHDVKNVSMHGNSLVITWNPGVSHGIDLRNVEAFNIEEAE